MKKILSSFLKKKSNANLSHRLSWLADLSQADDTDRLRTCIKHITFILNDTSLIASEKINLLLSIQDINLKTVNNQIIIFAKADYLKPNIANNMMDTNYAYHRIIFLALIKLIEMSYGRPSHQQPSTHIKLALITRALISAIHMLKWRYFEHATAPASLWKQASQLYQYAKDDAIHKESFQPYQEMPATTVESLMLQLYMLGGLNFNNLVKQQLKIISDLLAIWTKEIRVKTKMESFHTFYIDLNKDQPALRIRKNTPTVLCLYWDLDEIEYTIDSAIESISSNKKMPLLDAITIQNPILIKETLSFLKKEWSRSGYRRQRRKEQRHETSRHAIINIGFQHVSEHLDELNLNSQSVRSLLDGSLNDKKIATSVVMTGSANTLVVGKEKWNITDESKLGLGTLIPHNSKLEIKPSKLVSILTMQSDARPAVGVVRNIKQIAGGNLKIGMEVLTDYPHLAYLKKFETKKEPETNQINIENDMIQNTEFASIYISKNVLSSNVSSLILPKTEYIPNTLYEVRFKNKREIVKLENPFEQGDDWVKVSFPEELL